jgi:ferric-dicitrate binding protein FerR (iron transport regulator)
MSNQPEQIADLLSDDSFLNYCFQKNEPDVLFWERWLQENPEKRGLLQDARRMAFILNISVSPEEKQSQWERVQVRLSPIRESNHAPLLTEPDLPVTHRKRRTFIFMIPAVGLVLCSVIFFWLKPAGKDSGHAIASVSYQTYTAPAGNRNNITLSDGSRILLNSNSRLRVPADFNHTDRKIMLEGDAFFEVAHDSIRPFIVMAQGTTTTALGTSFRINAYADEPTASISLVTGKVKVTVPATSHAGALTLYPGKQIVVNKERQTETQMNFDTGEVMDWVNGKLVFNNDTPASIARKLQDWYGMKVMIPHPVKKASILKEHLRTRDLAMSWMRSAT